MLQRKKRLNHSFYSSSQRVADVVQQFVTYCQATTCQTRPLQKETIFLASRMIPIDAECMSQATVARRAQTALSGTCCVLSTQCAHLTLVRPMAFTCNAAGTTGDALKYDACMVC
jgi:hypothetical protein